MQIWDLFEGTRLFRAEKDGHLNVEQHLAEMASLMGPPPREFLEGSKEWRKYWDGEGMLCLHHSTTCAVLHFADQDGGLANWIAATPIPDQALETREGRLQGKEKELLLTFVRKLLRWRPEERPAAQDIFEGEFLVSHRLED
jgi:hypothetical protein